MIYRDFEIYPWSNGFDYFHKEYNGDEDKRCGHCSTIDECKDAIDDYYFERTTYKVLNPNSKTITKFHFWEDAVAFCKSCCIGLHCIQLNIAGFNAEFDSV